jgi:prepilin-type N-terminal cleavage/methylation domain-containing protein
MQTKQKAFTLVEMIVAMAVSTIIIAATYASYEMVSTQYKKNLDIAEMHQSGRAIMQMIERDIRMAGFKYIDKDAKVTYGSITGPLVIKDSGDKCCDEVTVIYDHVEDVLDWKGRLVSSSVNRIRIHYWTEAYTSKKGDRYRLYKQKDILGKNNVVLANPIIGNKEIMADYIEDFQIANIIESMDLFTAYHGYNHIVQVKPPPLAELDKNKRCLNCQVGWFRNLHTIGTIAIGPDGLIYVGHSGYESSIAIWDPETKKQVGKIYYVGRSSAIAFGPNGLLYTGYSSGNGIDVYQPRTRAELSKKPDCRDECKVGSIPNTGRVTALAFGPDGYLYAGSYSGYEINIWNVQSKEKHAFMRNTGRVRALAFGPNGLLYAGNVQNQFVRIFDPKTLGEVGKILNAGRIVGLAFGSDGLLYIGNGPYSPSIFVYKIKTPAEALIAGGHWKNFDCNDCRIGGIHNGYSSVLVFRNKKTGQESLVTINLTLRAKNEYGKKRQFKKKDYHGGNFNLDKTDRYKRDTFSSSVLVRNLML